MKSLTPVPPSLITRAGQPLFGLWAGWMPTDPRGGGARRGRRRAWSYTAVAGPGDTAFGAAIVHLGYVSTGFAWAYLDGQMHTWEAKGVPMQASIGRTPATRARFVTRGAHVRIHEDGALELDVPTDGGRLRISTVRQADDGGDVPATLVTQTVGGGWNSTQKVAGEAFTYLGEVGGQAIKGDGLGWRDWTVGAQDRHTRWRWAAGTGHADDGRKVGLNISTGMNEHGPGENVVWWDGQPYHLDVESLGPTSRDMRGSWRLGGPSWELAFTTLGVRAANENLGMVRSSYVQPFGRFEGTLPSPDGDCPVTLMGVTEDHEATW